MIDKELIDKYLNGELTKEEMVEVKAYLQQEDLTVLEQYMQSDWEDTSKWNYKLNASLSDEILENISQQVFEKRKVRHLNTRRILQIAAAFALLTIVSFVVRWQLKVPSNDTTIVMNESSTVKKVSLNDGSVVWLNKSSHIRYDEAFNNSIRAVTLEGEAFFDIATDSIKPFIVNSGEIRTRVLGTSFNIQSYPEMDEVKVALVEGKVSIEVQSESQYEQQVILSPGEILTFNKKGKAAITEKYLANAPYAWRDGVIYFDRADIHEVVSVLEDWYDIELNIITVTEEPLELKHRIDVTNMSIEQVLDGIERVSEYHFEKQSKTAYDVIPD